MYVCMHIICTESMMEYLQSMYRQVKEYVCMDRESMYVRTESVCMYRQVKEYVCTDRESMYVRTAKSMYGQREYVCTDSKEYVRTQRVCMYGQVKECVCIQTGQRVYMTVQTERVYTDSTVAP